MSKILIIEDDPAIQLGVEEYLSSQGYTVVKSSDGKQGFEIALEQKPDLILLDVNLPRLNGFDLCQIVKTNKKTKDIPVIILSASAQRSEIDRGFQMGANDYITLPFVPDDVMKRICTLIG